MSTTATSDNLPSCFRCLAPAMFVLVKEHLTAPERSFAFAVCRAHFLDVGGTVERLYAIISQEIAAEWN